MHRDSTPLRIIGWIAAVCGISLLLPWSAPGQSATARTPDAFARTLVAAINSRSIERRVALLHAQSRTCITPQTRPYFESLLASSQPL
jgi:hypothetical protein